MASANQQKTIKDLRQERCKLVSDARKIVDKAESEKRGMNPEEKGAWERLMRDVDEMKDRVDTLERQGSAEDEEEEEDREEDEEDEEEAADDDDDEEEGDEDDDDRSLTSKVIVKNGKKYVLQKRSNRRTLPGGRLPARQMPGESARDFETRKRRSSPEYREVFNQFLLNGNQALGTRLAARAIQADSDIVGGYLIAPQEFVAKLIKFVNNYVFMRALGTVYTVKSAQSLGAPSLDTDVSDADWTSELDTGNEDDVMSFGKREMTPRPLAKRLKVSNRLLRLGQITGGLSADNSVVTGGAEALVRDRLAYKFAVTEEKAFQLGSGANQPLGLFTPSSMGIDNSRDIQTGTTGAIVGDDLINCKYNQKIQYWPRLRWLFSRPVLSYIRKLKDGNGQYMWVPGGFGGEQDTLLDVPVLMSEYTPSTIASGQYVGALFDPSFYWIVDSLELQIQRLNELYAAADQTGFIARMELDGMPVLAEAFTRLVVK